jgi:hypothetical protein
LIREIQHEEVLIHKRGDDYHLGEDEPLSKRLEEFHEYVLLTAAAAVYNATGSLKKAASLLWWAGFWAEEEDLRRWVEENQERIVAHADAGSARAVAGLE